MTSNASRWIANVLIWTGLALIIFGCALAYPFMHDAILAQSDPSVSLSFVVTPPPAPTEVASVAPTDTSTPLPVSEVPVSATSSLVPSATAVPAPVILPDSNTVVTRAQTLPSVALPTPVAAGDPPDWLVIPSIQLDAPVEMVGWHLEQGMSVWDVPARRAAGWLKTSAPAGQKGNTVLDGHHNIQGEVFRRLVDLKPGDVVELFARDNVYRYGVTEKHILPDRDEPIEIRIANARWIQPTNDERLTLVTCWPYTNNTHRLIIVARPLAPDRMEKRIE